MTERRILRNVWHTRWHVPTNEQHGRTPGVPLAVVHHLYHLSLLVFYHRVVVPTIASLLHRDTRCSAVIVYVLLACHLRFLELTAGLLLQDIIKRHN